MMIVAGRIDRKQLTPALSKQYSEVGLSRAAAEFSGIGDIESFAFRGAKRSGQGATYTYFVHFAAANDSVTITLERAGRIAAFDVSQL
ncbi:MAG: hypothetical protein M3126_04920 [Candidatus Eremiobacteraeota bacterium]|nr:hypothetical protein [Candidatus Eremiobacteraeota bacterium]